MSERGKFIVIEGIDGAETTTLARTLTNKIANLYSDTGKVMMTHEPNGEGPIGKMIRDYLNKRDKTISAPKLDKLDWRGWANLFAADRRDHIARWILPAIDTGTHIICDRYVLSSVVYQAATAPEHVRKLDAMDWISDQVNKSILIPDLTIFLDTSTEVAAERRTERDKNETVFESKTLQEKISILYDKYIPHYEYLYEGFGYRVLRVDGNQKQGKVVKSCWKSIRKLIGK
jgi:dTMP kinase